MWYVSRILLKLAASYNLAAGTQTRQVNKGKVSPASRSEMCSCEKIMCGMGAGSISGGYVAKQQTENWGKRTGIYILVVIQEQVDVGVGWI